MKKLLILPVLLIPVIWSAQSHGIDMALLKDNVTNRPQSRLSLQYPKWYVITPSFLWATTVAYSRLDLGQHYPSDVIAGALIGTGSAWLSYKVQQWIDKKYKIK